tara:strand:+ start:196 stop:414 length:219 start_codon:yes stop_codon:yes gene_type:complete
MTRINKNHKRNGVVGKKKARKQQKAKAIADVHASIFKHLDNQIINATEKGQSSKVIYKIGNDEMVVDVRATQ